MIKKIIDENGQPWNVEIKDDRVRFYDARYMHTELGQFVSEYYTKTILSGESGLLLDGGVDSWSISNTGMAEIRTWLREQI